MNRTFTVRFEDVTEAESRPLLEFLWEHCVRPEQRRVMLKWTPR